MTSRLGTGKSLTFFTVQCVHTSQSYSPASLSSTRRMRRLVVPSRSSRRLTEKSLPFFYSVPTSQSYSPASPSSTRRMRRLVVPSRSSRRLTEKSLPFFTVYLPRNRIRPRLPPLRGVCAGWWCPHAALGGCRGALVGCPRRGLGYPEYIVFCNDDIQLKTARFRGFLYYLRLFGRLTRKGANKKLGSGRTNLRPNFLYRKPRKGHKGPNF